MIEFTCPYKVASDLLTTSFHPSSCLLLFFGLDSKDILVVEVVVVRVTARHCAAAVATVMGESSLWGVAWVMIVDATALVISAVVMMLGFSCGLGKR